MEKKYTKNIRVYCRLNSEEYKELKANMKKKNISNTSEYIREQIKVPLEVSQKDLNKIKREVSYEINKIGNNINQITRYLNTYQVGAPVNEILDEQKRIENILKDIVDILSSKQYN